MVEAVGEAKVEAAEVAAQKAAEEASDEDGLQSQSAAELGSDSPAPTPCIPVSLSGPAVGHGGLFLTDPDTPNQPYPLHQREFGQISHL